MEQVGRIDTSTLPDMEHPNELLHHTQKYTISQLESFFLFLKGMTKAVLVWINGF
jgi:hypothetical protein